MIYHNKSHTTTTIPFPETEPKMPKVASPKTDNANKIDNTNKVDNVNHPSHYTDGKIEVIDYIEDKQLGFCLGNAVKYISRAGKKKSGSMSDKEKEIEDLKKAVFYINYRIKELEIENNEPSNKTI